MAKSQPLEKQCSNGVIYCQLLDAVRPGSLNLTKVNMEDDAVSGFNALASRSHQSCGLSQLRRDEHK